MAEVLREHGMRGKMEPRPGRRTSASRSQLGVLLLVAALFLTSCEKEPQLSPAETFDWCQQPIAFQPPPDGWRREKHNEGGLLGVRFTLTGSVGERMYFAEYYKVGRRSEREEHRTAYRLEDVVEEVRFRPEHFVTVDSLYVFELQPDSVAVEPAFSLDFFMTHEGREYVGREYYMLRNNYLFVAAYLGLLENLELFDRVVASISFPEATVR